MHTWYAYERKNSEEIMAKKNKIGYTTTME